MDKINVRPENNEELNGVKKQKIKEEKSNKHDIASNFQTVDKKCRKTNKQTTKSMLNNSSRTENEANLTIPVNITTKKLFVFSIRHSTRKSLHFWMLKVSRKVSQSDERGRSRFSCNSL